MICRNLTGYFYIFLSSNFVKTQSLIPILNYMFFYMFYMLIICFFKCSHMVCFINEFMLDTLYMDCISLFLTLLVYIIITIGIKVYGNTISNYISYINNTSYNNRYFHNHRLSENIVFLPLSSPYFGWTEVYIECPSKF